MTEKTTLEVIAPTVQEAIAQGLAQLGLTADAVSIEILDAGTKGFFGLGKPQVRVRLTVNPPSDVKPVSEGTAVETGSTPASKPEAKPLDQTQGKPAPVPEAESQPEHDPILDLSEATVSKLLHMMKLEAQVSAHYGETDREERRTINVDIRGDDLSILIGRHSETLNAFQYIASLIVGKETQQWVQFVIDVEGYRTRREKQLQQMARRVAEQVSKTGRKQTLEPMPAAERRIIHMALREHPAVTTESTGEEPYRKISIIPKQE